MMKKSILLICTIIITITFACIMTYAYFSTITDFYNMELSASGDQTIIAINNEKDLRLVASASKWNDSKLISQLKDRKVVKLNNNIQLTKDLIITSDININLNSYSLDLNGHSITFENYYQTILWITNGSIKNSAANSSNIMINTPNAFIQIDNELIKTNIIVTYQSFDSDLLSTKIFKYIEEVVYADLSKNYYHDDIPLVFNYYNYPVEFKYTSNKENVLSSYGAVNVSGIVASNGIEEVVLTLELTFQNNNVYSEEYAFNILNKDHSYWLTIGKNIFYETISEFWNKTLQYYEIKSDIQLIKNYSYGNLTYTYSSSDVENYILDYNTLSLEKIVLVKIINASGSISLTVTFKKILATSNFERADELIATFIEDGYLYVVKDGDQNIYFNNIKTMTGTSGDISLENIFILPSASDFTGYQLDKISYSIIGDSYGSYIIKEVALDGKTYTILTVDKSNPPSVINQIFLSMEFKFSDGIPLTVVRRVGIAYDPFGDIGAPTDDIGPNDLYIDYYRYLNSLLIEKTGLDTHHDFEMPSEYLNCKFRYRLVAWIDQNNKYTGALNFLTITYNSEDGHFDFTFDWDKVPLTDLYIEIIFSFKLNTRDDYEEVSDFPYSRVLVQGFIHNGVDVIDNNLYNALLKAYGDITDGILLRNQLAVNREIFSLSGYTGIANFEGLQYLDNTKYLDLSDQNFTNATYITRNFAIINSLVSLEGLNLSGNSLTTLHLSYLSSLSKIKKLDISNNNIELFYSLEEFSNLTEIKVYNNYTSDTNYGTNGLYNKYSFIFLAKKGVLIYITNTTTFSYTAAQLVLQQTLSGIIYRRNNSYANATNTLTPFLNATPFSTTYGYTITEMTAVSTTGRPHAVILRIYNKSDSSVYITRLLILD